MCSSYIFLIFRFVVFVEFLSLYKGEFYFCLLHQEETGHRLSSAARYWPSSRGMLGGSGCSTPSDPTVAKFRNEASWAGVPGAMWEGEWELGVIEKRRTDL